MSILRCLLDVCSSQNERESSNRRSRVRFQSAIEPLECRASLSQIHGVPSPDAIFLASQSPTVASEQRTFVPAAFRSTQLGANAKSIGPVVVRGATSPAATIGYESTSVAAFDSVGSGKVEPPDPGGIELAKVAR
jgi:hypothetical protein